MNIPFKLGSRTVLGRLVPPDVTPCQGQMGDKRAQTLARAATETRMSWAYSVELRGLLSRHETGKGVCSIQDLIADGAVYPSAGGCSTAASQRPWRVIDRLGHVEISQLVADFVAGATRDALAVQYAISLSSVKRLLRQRCVHRS